MLESPLTDFTVDLDDDRRGNSLVLVSDRSFYLSDNDRLVFCPFKATTISGTKAKEFDFPEIPIRKIEPDTTLEDVLASLIVSRPKNLYIRLSDISKSISWWIVNNAEELDWPDSVRIEYMGTNGKCSVEFRRTGKRKWDPEFVKGRGKDNSIRKEFNRIRRELWNEDV
jgi:hypothetical protein